MFMLKCLAQHFFIILTERIVILKAVEQTLQRIDQLYLDFAKRATVSKVV
jgi:hypothetical protein